jgi:sugar/nucleoside kinase (ribokinase family)
MTLVDDTLSQRIYDATDNLKREIATGGSVANTIHTLACLGGNSGYISKIGHDRLGKLFFDELGHNGVRNHLVYSEKSTGRVVSLVTPDSERTMATFLGAASDLKETDINPELFDGYEWFFVEGYLVYNQPLIEYVIDLAREKGLKIAIDLASYNVVEANLHFLKKLLKEKVDLIFANEEEAHALTGKDPEGSLSEIASICGIAVVKTGKKGSLIQQGDKFVRINPVSAMPIDTTGAGDNYAAGFFYGLTKGYSLETCGNIAAIVAGRSVEVIGAKIPEANWPEILEKVSNLVQNKP